MKREEIGMNAGLVWNALNEKGSLTVKDLKKATKLKDKQIFAALGWLSREDKISVEEIENDLKVSLIG
ncbi:MAG: winged helix-turn-helix domain-containing protein [Porphyromonadaceae bacterium]|nr:winged helix-turn-helix domain-containing protein [Porphyromonadaceae bacterium]MCD8287819.1 winged helix-turn-helix domain-containing protein [Porphyromonadaceae bacterium]